MVYNFLKDDGEKVVEPTYTPEHKLEKLYEQIEQLEKNLVLNILISGVFCANR